MRPHYKYTAPLFEGKLFRGSGAYMIYDWNIAQPETQTKVEDK